MCGTKAAMDVECGTAHEPSDPARYDVALPNMHVHVYVYTVIEELVSLPHVSGFLNVFFFFFGWCFIAWLMVDGHAHFLSKLPRVD